MTTATEFELMLGYQQLEHEWMQIQCKKRVEANIDAMIDNISPPRFDINDLSSFVETAKSLRLFVHAVFLYKHLFIKRYNDTLSRKYQSHKQAA